MKEAEAETETVAPVAATGGRLASLDVLRGVIMVVMVLDHTRDFFTDGRINPTNLATTTTPLFFTRWVTHFSRRCSSSWPARRPI